MLINVNDGFMELYESVFKDADQIFDFDADSDFELALSHALLRDVEALQDLLHEETGTGLYYDSIKKYRDLRRLVDIQKTIP